METMTDTNISKYLVSYWAPCGLYVLGPCTFSKTRKEIETYRFVFLKKGEMKEEARMKELAKMRVRKRGYARRRT